MTPNCTASWQQRTKSGEDAYGNDTFTEATVSVNAIFAPGGSAETVNGEDMTVTQPTVYLPLPAPTAIDALTIDGDEYEVDGQPQTWPGSPFTGWQPDYPVVVRLRQVTG